MQVEQEPVLNRFVQAILFKHEHYSVVYLEKGGAKGMGLMLFIISNPDSFSQPAFHQSFLLPLQLLAALSHESFFSPVNDVKQIPNTIYL